MIRKMTKYSFIVYHRDADDFFDRLKEIGLMDITRSPRAFDDVSRKMFDDATRYANAIRTLKNIAKKNEGAEIPKFDCPSDKLLETIEDLLSGISLLETRRQVNDAAAKEAALWGDFRREDLDRLTKMGITVHAFSMKRSEFDKRKIASTYPVVIMSEIDDRLRFVIPVRNGDPFTPPSNELSLPERPTREIAIEAAEIKADIKENDRRLLALSARVGELEEKKTVFKEQFDLYSAVKSTNKAADGALMLYEGFAPADDDAKVKEALDQTGAYYETRPATTGDNPPIELKNNKFAKLFEPITKMYMLPRYDDDLDLTPYYCIFYMLFFGLCLGDMGYGLVLLIAGLFATLKMPKFREYGKLVIVLGIGAMIMPILTGSFFGANLYDLFPQLRNSLLPLSNMSLFWFAILFGIFQILFGRIIAVIHAVIHKGWLSGLANVGWILVLVWCTVAYAGSEIGHKLPFQTPAFNYICGLGGLALIVLFSKTTGNVFARIFKGVTSLYDITGLFGDILSYIRLFGLCVSGGILGMVIDSMALKMAGIPYAGYPLMIILLLIGHAFVMALCALGAFVHPMRLTFVEFYKNVGFTGGGKAYRPLTK